MGKLSAVARDEKSRFRVTPSVAEPIAEPNVFAWKVELEDDDIVRFLEPIDPPRRLPPDFYIRELRDVDLTNPSALLDLIQTSGRIAWPIEVPLLLSPSRGAGAGRSRTTLAEVRGHITALRWASDTWITARDGALEDAEKTTALIDILNEGLRAFSPFVWSPGVSHYAPDNSTPFPPSAYSAACLQLFNDIAISAPFRRCQNTSCGRIFVRQRGRAEYQQYRLRGVKYCSYLCARVKAQRDYRRRKEGST